MAATFRTRTGVWTIAGARNVSVSEPAPAGRESNTRAGSGPRTMTSGAVGSGPRGDSRSFESGSTSRDDAVVRPPRGGVRSKATTSGTPSERTRAKKSFSSRKTWKARARSPRGNSGNSVVTTLPAACSRVSAEEFLKSTFTTPASLSARLSSGVQKLKPATLKPRLACSGFTFSEPMPPAKLN